MEDLKFVATPILAIGGSMFLWLYVRIVVHETAHVVVGKMVGFKPYKMVVGTGSNLCHLHLFGVEVILRVLPIGGGYTLSRRPNMENLRWRGALFSIAGIASEAALLCLILGIVAGVLKEGLNMGLTSFVLWYIAYFQAGAILFSLWPKTITFEAGVIGNDARQFFHYVSGKVDKAIQVFATEYEINVRRYDPQFQIENSWVKKDLESSLRILADIEAHRKTNLHEAAIEQYLEILKSEALSKGERARFLDAMASIAVIDGVKSFSERAMAWVREANELFPNARTLHGTYGGALVESGSYAEGIKILTPLTAKENTPIDRSISACYLAKAHHHLGNAAEADAFLTLGKALNASCGVCERIEQELMLPKNDSG